MTSIAVQGLGDLIHYNDFNALVDKIQNGTDQDVNMYKCEVNGQTIVGNDKKLYDGSMKEPTGFPNRTDTSLSFDDGNMRLTVTKTGASYDYYIQGVKYTKTDNDTVDITDTEGIWYIYYDGATLTANQSEWDIAASDKALVSIVYWDATNNTAFYVADERHGTVMDASTHDLLHYTVGTRFDSGFAISGYTLNTASDAAVQFGIASGVIYDEDIEISIVADATPTNPFEQILADPAEIPVYYRDGATAWRKDAATTFAFKNTAAGRVNYNKLNGTWAQQEATDGYYVAVWIFATNSQSEPIISMQGQREDSKLVDAIANNLYGDLVFGTLPFPEMKVLYRIILQTKDSFGVTRYAKIQDISDFRRVSNLPGTTIVSSHTSLSDLNGGPYGDGAHLNMGVSHIEASTDPTVNDDVDSYKELTSWLTQSDDGVFICTDNTDGAAVWKEIAFVGNSPTFGSLIISDNSATITHSGNTSLTIVSTNGTVIVESVTFTGAAMTGISNATLSGILTITGTNAGQIDLNPANTGSQDVIDITPTASLAQGSTWRGIFIDGQNLDPDTGTACLIRGVSVDFSGFTSTDNDSLMIAYLATAAPTETCAAFYHEMTELTVAKTQSAFVSDGNALALSATATYRGLYVNWDLITRNGGSPVLEGIRIDLPVDYTNYGTTFAAHFCGGGDDLYICDGTNSITADGIISGGTLTDGTMSIASGALSAVTTISAVNTLTITCADAANANCITLDQQDTGATDAMTIANAGTGYGLSITQTGIGYALHIPISSDSLLRAINVTGAGSIGGANGILVNISGNSQGCMLNVLQGRSNPSAPVVKFGSSNASSTLDILEITNTSISCSILIDQNGDTGSAKAALKIENTGNDGYAMHIVSANTGAVDNPLVKFESDNAGFDQFILSLTQDGTGAGGVITSLNAGTGHGIILTQSGELAAGKHALEIISSADQDNDNLVKFECTHTSTTKYVLEIQQLGTGAAGGMYIHNDSTSPGIHIEQDGTGNAITINQDGDVGTTRSTDGALFIENSGNNHAALNVYSTNNATQVGNLVNFEVTDAAFDLSVLAVRNAGVGNSITVIGSGTGNGIVADISGVLASGKYGLLVTTNVTQNASPLVYFNQDDASSDQHVLDIHNDGTASCVNIAGPAATTTQRVFIDFYAATAQYGKIFSFDSATEQPQMWMQAGVVANIQGVLSAIDQGHDAPGLLHLRSTDGGASAVDYYFWVDSAGDLRINNARPSDQDVDGAVVGDQTA